MSDINCAACDDLRNHAPTFVNEGVTDEICASLQNNTGLNPNAIVIHRNDEDLHNANDCLIARMYNEVVKVEVCDWKEFMQKFIPNLYELQKALICDSTGIWLKIDDLYIKIGDIDNRVTVLEEKVEKIPDDFDPSEYAKKSDIPPAPDLSPYALKSEIPVVPIDQINQNTDDIDELQEDYSSLCRLMNQTLTNSLDEYGILVGHAFDSETARKGGEIISKSGVPAASARPAAEIGDHDSLGISYRKETFRNCSGELKTYEWIQPRFYTFIFGSNVEYNDVIWRVSVTKLREWGLTEGLINNMRQYPQWWDGYGNSLGERKESTLMLRVVGDYLEMVYVGSLGNMQSAYVDSFTLAPNLWIS